MKVETILEIAKELQEYGITFDEMAGVIQHGAEDALIIFLTETRKYVAKPVKPRIVGEDP